jgi:hypothetical protein
VVEAASGVRAAIEQDRAELAETVQALVQKADVKERVRETVSEKAGELQQKASAVGDRVRSATPDDAQRVVGNTAAQVRRNPLPLVLVGVFVLGVMIGRVVRHRHR